MGGRQGRARSRTSSRTWSRARPPPVRGIAPRRWGHAFGRRGSRDSAAGSSWVTPVIVERPRGSRRGTGSSSALGAGLAARAVRCEAAGSGCGLAAAAGAALARAHGAVAGDGLLGFVHGEVPWWLDDGLSSMTITFVDRCSWRQRLETNRRLRSCSGRWHRPNGLLFAQAVRRHQRRKDLLALFRQPLGRQGQRLPDASAPLIA